MLNLSANSIEIWLIDEQTAIEQQWIQAFAHVLSNEEHTRAQACKSAKRQQQFQVTRIALRHILSLYFPSLSPKQHVFMQTANGKPYLSNNACQFNVSHSRGKIMIAMSKILTLGIDIEFMSAKRDVDKITHMYFHPKEWPKDLPLHERLKQFYQIWTLKEAFVKGEGQGLFMPAKGFYFDINTKRPQLVTATPNPLLNKKWKFAHCFIANEFSLALAWENKHSTTPIEIVSRRLESDHTFTQLDLF